MRTAEVVMSGLLAVAVITAVQDSASARQSQKPPATPDAVSAVGNAYVKAVLAGDAKAVAALYSEDAVEMPPNQPPIKGRAAIQEYYQKQFAAGVKVGRFALTHLDSHLMGDRGYDVGTYDQNMTPPGGKTAVDETGKYTVILRRVGNDWKIAYAIYNTDKAPMH